MRCPPLTPAASQSSTGIDLKGFGVLCSGRTNAKTYVVQRGLGDGRRRRVTVGACNVLALADARGKAEQVLSEFYAGRDPKAGRKEKSTLHEALEDYLAANKKLSAASRRYYRLYVEKHLHTWCDVPLKMITPEMVEARHRKIQKEVADENKNGHATGEVNVLPLKACGSASQKLVRLTAVHQAPTLKCVGVF